MASTPKGFSLYGSSLYSSRDRQTEEEEAFYVPHVMRQLAGLPTQLQSEDVKLYQRLVQGQDLHHFVIKRDKIKASPFDVTDGGQTDNYTPPRKDDFVVNWVTAPNIYQASLQAPLQVRTPQLLGWEFKDIEESITKVADQVNGPVIMRNSKTERQLDKLSGGVLFTGGILSGIVSGKKSLDQTTEWFVNDLGELKEEVTEPLVFNDLITCVVDGTNTDTVTSKKQLDQNDYYMLDVPIPFSTKGFPLCHRRVSVDFNRLTNVQMGTQVATSVTDATRIETAPMNLLNVTTTLVNTLGTSHSVLPINLAELKSRPMWFKDILFLGTDPKTQQDLIFQSFQRGVQHTLDEFKKVFSIKVLPYEVNGKDTFLNVMEETLSRGSKGKIPTEPTQTDKGLGSKVSDKWIRLLKSSLSTNNYSIDMMECIKEFGLTETLLEGSKILALSHNFLLRCVGINQDGSLSETIGECYEECLPFDIILERDVPYNIGVDGASKLHNGGKVTFSHLKQLELYANAAFYQDTGRYFNNLVLTQPVPAVSENAVNGVNESKDYVETATRRSIPPHLNMKFKLDLPLTYSSTIPPSLVKVEPVGTRGAFAEAIAGNSMIEEVFTDGASKGHVLSEKTGNSFLESLLGILKKYNALKRSVQNSVIETHTLIETMIGTVLPSGVNVKELIRIWEGIERNSLLCLMVNEICQMWFQSFDIWMVQSANIRDLLFHYNNDPYAKASSYTQDWKAVGCIGQASWYAVVQWVFSVFNLSVFPKSTLEEKQWELFHDEFFENISEGAKGASGAMDDMDLTKYANTIYDSLKFYFYSSLTCLAPNPRNTVSPSSMHQLLRESEKKIKNEIFFGEWCLFIDGVRPVIHDPRTLSCLYSKDLYNQYFQKFGLEELIGIKNEGRKTIKQHKARKDDTWRTDFIPTCGCMLVKQSRSVPTLSSSSSKSDVTSFNVGLTKAKTILNTTEYNQTHEWYPFQLELPINPIFRSTEEFSRKFDYPGMITDAVGSRYVDPDLRLGKKHDLFMNSPNEYCLITGDVMQSQRFSPGGTWLSPSTSLVPSSEPQGQTMLYSVLTGLQKTLELAPFPMESSTCLVQGIEIFKEYFQELVALEKVHITRCMAPRHEKSHKRGQHYQDAQKETKISTLDYVKYKQIRYNLQQAKIALNQLSPEISPWYFLNADNGQHDDLLSMQGAASVPKDAKKFFNNPSPSILSSYSLEWHSGSEYGGIRTFISKGDISPTLYRTRTEEEFENAGLYTLWMVNDNPNKQFTTAVLHNSPEDPCEEFVLVDPKYPDLGNYATSVNAIRATESANWNASVVTATTHLNAVNVKVQENLLLLGNPSLDASSFNPIHVIEDVLGAEVENGGSIFSNLFEQFSPKEVDGSRLYGVSQTLDFSAVPSYTLAKICTLQVQKMTPPISTPFEVEAEPSDTTTDSTVNLTQGTQINHSEFENHLSLVDSANTQSLDIESHKHEPITESYSIDAPYMTALVKDVFTQSKISKIVCSKYMGGKYVTQFSQPLETIQNAKYSDVKSLVPGLPNYLEFTNWAEIFTQTVNRTMLQHFLPTGVYKSGVVHKNTITPLSRYLQSVSTRMTNMFKTLTQFRPHSSGNRGYLSATLCDIDTVAKHTVTKPVETWIKSAISGVLKTYLNLAPMNHYNPKWSTLPTTTMLSTRFNLPLLVDLLSNTVDSQSTRKKLESHCTKLVPKYSRSNSHTLSRNVQRKTYENSLVSMKSLLWWICYSLYEIPGHGAGKTETRLRDAIGLSPAETKLTFVLKHKVNVHCLDSITGKKFIWNPRSNIALIESLHGTVATQMDKQRETILKKSEGTCLGDIPIRELVDGICGFTARHMLFNFFSKAEITPTGRVKDSVLLLEIVPFLSLVKHFSLIFKELETLYLSYHNQGGEWDLDAWENSSTFGDSNVTTWFARFGKGPILGRHALSQERQSPVELMRLSLLQKMADTWVGLQSACLTPNRSGVYDMQAAMKFLEENEDKWTQLFVDLARSIRDPESYKGAYDERKCESLNLISRDYLLYLTFKECHRQIRALEDSLDPILNIGHSKNMNLKEWYSIVLLGTGKGSSRFVQEEERFGIFCEKIQKQHRHAWDRTQGERLNARALSQEQLLFLWDLITGQPMTCGDLVVLSEEFAVNGTRQIKNKIKLDFLPTKARFGQRPPRWVSDWKQLYTGTWKQIKGFIKDPQSYTQDYSAPSHPLGAFMTAAEGQLDASLYTKYDLLRLFGGYINSCNVQQSDFTIGNTVLLFDERQRSGGHAKLYRHYETSDLKALRILSPALSRSSEAIMFFFEEWLKTCFLPSLMHGYWISLADPKNTELQTKLQQQWAILLQKVTGH